MTSNVVEDEIVTLTALGEVLLGVVDHVVCADRSDHVHVPRAADAGYFGGERLRDLHCERPHPARRTSDQDLLSWLDVPLISESLEGGKRRRPDGRGLLERVVGRLQCQRVFGS
jgi:hypothetical protein